MNNLPSTRFIVDVGCSWSASRTMGLRERFGIPVVFIDPDTDSLDRIKTNPGDIKVPAAITSYDGEAWFHFYTDGTHSLLETNLEEVQRFIDGHTGKPALREDWIPTRTVKVPCYRLETVVDMHGIEAIEFLKVDAQGHDLEVVKSLGEAISSVKFFEVEVQTMDFELYRGSSRVQDVMDFAAANGFELIHAERQTFDQERMLVFRNIHLRTPQGSTITPQVLVEILSAPATTSSEVGRSRFVDRLMRVARRLRYDITDV